MGYLKEWWRRWTEEEEHERLEKQLAQAEAERPKTSSTRGADRANRQKNYEANYENMFVWTTMDVARCCGVTRDTVYKWVSQGRIVRVKRHGRDYFRPRDAKRMARRWF